jgi:branched-chain amino acid transport system permease protein
VVIMLAEGLRIGFGTKAVGWDNLVYGVLLVMFIIFLPKGILGSIAEKVKARRKPATNARPSPIESIEGADKTRTFRI